MSDVIGNLTAEYVRKCISNFPIGRIIVFEGLDCSFKETNSKAFLRNMEEIGSMRNTAIQLGYADGEKVNKIEFESFPRYGHTSCFGVEMWLKGLVDRDVLRRHPLSVWNLYAIDRFRYWFGYKMNAETGVLEETHRYNEYMKKNNTYIFDRYSTSNPLYTSPTGKLLPGDLCYEYQNWNIPKPDMVVFMRCGNFVKIKETLAAKENKDANEMDFSYLEAAWDRCEEAIEEDTFGKAGIMLVVVDVLDDNGEFKTREQLEHDVFHAVMDKFIYKEEE